MNKLNNHLILILLFFALAITFCGTSAAAVTHSNQTINTNTTTPTNQTLNTTTTTKPTNTTNTTTTTSTSKPITTTTTTTSTTSKPNTANTKPSTTTNTTTTTTTITSNPTTTTTITSNPKITTTKTITTTTKTTTKITKTTTTTTTITTAAIHKGDPIISGTVYVDDYSTKTLANATITVTSMSGRILDTTTTDQNGNYNISFYSTDSSFIVTASYPGCNNVTQTVTVSPGSKYPTDPNYYGTSSFTLTPLLATLESLGNGASVYVGYQGGYNYFTGVINEYVNNIPYQAFCIDLYTDITIGNTLWVNGPLPGTLGSLSNEVDWSKVTYIINHYTPSSNTEAAAMQCAIWYFSTAQYGPYPGVSGVKYQFMTDPSDGLSSDGTNTVQQLAWQMIDSAQDMLYPKSIVLNPGIIQLPNGQPENIIATVHDQNGNPLSGVTVNFTTTSGNLNTYSGVTNSNGQVTVTLTPTADDTSVSVTGQVIGNYGNLLYDDPSNPLQNLVAINVLPYTVANTAIINYDATANVALTQTANSPVNVGDPVTYTVTATNQGPNPATGIVINDTAPSGLSGTPSPGTTYYNGVWTIPSLAIDGTATLTITGTATSSMAGTNTINNATRTAQNEYDNLNPTSLASVYTLLPTSLTLNPASGDKGDKINLTATLTDTHNSVPVRYETVKF